MSKKFKIIVECYILLKKYSNLEFNGDIFENINFFLYLSPRKKSFLTCLVFSNFSLTFTTIYKMTTMIS